VNYAIAVVFVDPSP